MQGNDLFEPIIGLEVHAEMLTESKMFCACAVVDSTVTAPNTSVCEVCIGMPGTLPVINQRAVEFGIRVGLALHCTIAETSVFARKNYFYPDLPKGYQISQYELPLAQNGWLEIETETNTKRIRIRRVHLEEDTARLFHYPSYSLIDYNRSGVPLLEIVTEPDIRSLEEAKAYATTLRSILRYLEVTSGDMEKGAMRFEANISLRRSGEISLGTRTEIKNLNSFRSMVRAVACEIDRQRELLSKGARVRQETLGWDEAREVTISQRGKEEAHDYRYFSDPDLPPLVIDHQWIEQIHTSLPELPEAKRNRFIEEYDLNPYLAGVLTTDREVAEYFEQVITAAPETSAEKIAHWITGDLFSLLHQANQPFSQCPITTENLAQLIAMVERGEISAKSGKEVLVEMFAVNIPPLEIVERRGLAQVNDIQEIDRLVTQVLEHHPEQVEQYIEGKTNLINWFFGQVMQLTQGRANPNLVRQTLSNKLRSLEVSLDKKKFPPPGDK